MLLQPGFAKGQYLFHPAPPDALADRDCFGEARVNRRAAPGFAGDEAVNLARAHRLDCQRRRQHAQHHVAVGIDARARQPVAQHQRMAGKAVDDADHRLAPPQADRRREVMGGAERIGQTRGDIGLQRLGEIAGHHQHVAVDAQLVGRGERGGLLAEAERHRHGKRGEHLRGVNLAEDEPVAQRRPAGGAHKVEGDAFFLGKAAFARGYKHGRIVERQEGDLQIDGHSPPPSKSLAVISACATSTIFLPWFIALDRSSA